MDLVNATTEAAFSVPTCGQPDANSKNNLSGTDTTIPNEFDPQAHQHDLYISALRGLAQSKANGKTAKEVTEDLKEISRKFNVSVRDAKADLKRFETKPNREKAQLKPSKPCQIFEYSAEAIERAKLLFDCTDKDQVYHDDFNDTGYRANHIQTLVGLLMLGSRFVNGRAWGDDHDLICGTQFGVTGPSTQGKSGYVKKVLKFVDCSVGDLQKRCEQISNCSDQYLAFAGGADGKDLADKVIWWDEIQSKGSMEYDRKIQIMGQTTSKGYYTHRSSVDTAEGRKPVEYLLVGTLNHVFTTVDPPAAFDIQFRTRTVWIRIGKTVEERWDVFSNKLKVEG